MDRSASRRRFLQDMTALGAAGSVSAVFAAGDAHADAPHDVITNDAIWSGMFGLAMIKGDARRFAEQSVAENPAPAEKEIAEADAALKGYLPDANPLRFVRQPWFG